MDLGSGGGPRRRKYVYGKTQREVRDRLAALRRELESGGRPADGRITFGDLLTEWLKVKRTQVKASTWRSYEMNMRRHVIPALGNVRLAKLTPEHLDQLYSDVLEEGLSPTSVRHLHTMLHGALKHAVRRGLVGRNVTELVDPPKARRHEFRTLSADETRRFLAAARDDPFEALYVMAVTTGMRQGELLGLRWRDVDLGSATVKVRGTLQRNFAYELEISDPKTVSSVRQVQLSGLAVDALERHRERQHLQREVAGAAWDDHGLVFTNEIGRPVNVSNLTPRSFKPLLRRAGIVGIRFHDLRHTAATLLLEQNVHPKVVSEMLGHADIGITLDLYSHVTPTMHAHAASTFDNLLGDSLEEPS